VPVEDLERLDKTGEASGEFAGKWPLDREVISYLLNRTK
jgi:hypothetical protein